MGELPPSCSTPQGPGVPWALRPRFPRVDSSRTTRVPSSRSVISHFAHLLLQGGRLPLRVLRFLSWLFSPFFSTVRYNFLHGSLRPRSLVFPSVSFPFLPLPCVRFSPVLSTSFPTPLPVPISFPLPRVSPRDSTLPRFLFSPLPVRLRFPQLPPPSSPVSFPFLPLPCVRFSPVLSTFVLFGSPVVFPPTWRSDSSPFSFRIPGSTAAFSRLGFCGPQVAPKRPHTSSKEAAKFTGTAAVIKPFLISDQYSGNKGLRLLISTAFQPRRSPLNLSIISLFLESSSVVARSSPRRRESTSLSTKCISPSESPRAIISPSESDSEILHP
ncbi:MAG: hypothetical protein CM1200mP21_03810 [Candidatus Poseidoniales archaeon]|nr:MAG: hypothetical protein CM1200mP21_03810 [Candidatus Poseidoniales archaeon]